MTRSFIFTARRYLSLCTPGTAEDVFPYYNTGAKWKELKSIRQPIAIVIGSRDEYLDFPAKKFIEIFRQNAKKSKSFSGIIVKGANHGFRGKEKELSSALMRWIKTIRLR